MTTPQAPGAPEGGDNNPSGAQPAPGAQEPAPQPQEPQNKPLGKPNSQAPGAPAKPAAEPAKTDPQDVSALPDWAQKQIKELRAEAGKARTNAKQQAAEEAQAELLAKISKTLGLNPDDEPTVESLTSQLAEREQRINELETAQTQQAYRETVRAAAKDVNADADALLDSASFLDAVDAELGDVEGFSDEQMAAAVKKVAAEYAKKPRFALSAAPARSGGEITGGPPPATKQRARSLNEAVRRQYGGG